VGGPSSGAGQNLERPRLYRAPDLSRDSGRCLKQSKSRRRTDRQPIRQIAPGPTSMPGSCRALSGLPPAQWVWQSAQDRAVTNLAFSLIVGGNVSSAPELLDCDTGSYEGIVIAAERAVMLGRFQYPRCGRDIRQGGKGQEPSAQRTRRASPRGDTPNLASGITMSSQAPRSANARAISSQLLRKQRIS